MFALNFQSPHHEQLLIDRQKSVTVRLGDIREIYPENSVVWVTYGKKHGPKKMLYPAIIDKVYVKRISELTSHDLEHQNPGIKTVEELIAFFEKIYEMPVDADDIVTVIYFFEILQPPALQTI